MKLSGPAETKTKAKRLRSTLSPPEVRLWSALRRNQTGFRFRRQHPTGPYVLDFYCYAARLCVEVDGEQHSFITGRDEVRDRWLHKQGVRTLRIPARYVLTDLDAVVRWIINEASTPSGGHCPPPPPTGEDQNRIISVNQKHESACLHGVFLIPSSR